MAIGGECRGVRDLGAWMEFRAVLGRSSTVGDRVPRCRAMRLANTGPPLRSVKVVDS